MNRGINSDWETKTLGDILTKIVGGGTPPRSNPAFWNGPIKWATVKDLTGKIVSGTQESITHEGLRACAASVIPKDTPIIATRMAVGKCVLFNCDVAINQDLKALFSNGEIQNKYLVSWLESQRSEFEARSNGSTVKGIRLEDIQGLEITLPPLKEQQKIAEILTSVDEVIENTQSQINKLEDLKKATMNELLTKGIGHTEFKDTEIGRIPSEWRIAYMREIAKFSGGAAFNESLQGNSSGDFPFIKVSDMNHPENTVWIQKSQNWITAQTRDSERIKLFPKNTIVFAKVGAALLTNRRRILVRDTAIDNNMMGAVAKDCNFMFLFWLLNSIDFRQIVQDGAVPSINQSQLDELRVALPDADEQTKIAHTLQSLHYRLDTLRDKLDSSKKLKQSLMQDLLTGKVRVSVN